MAGVFLFLMVFLPGAAAAQEQPGVVINEISWMGTPVAGIDANQHWRYEWLELYNAKESPLQVDGWSIELYRDNELYFQVPLQGIIPSNGYFLLGASDKIPNININYANLGGKFVNTGMRVVLSRCARSPEGRKDNPCEIIDEVDARDGWPAGDNESKRTMERAVARTVLATATTEVSAGNQVSTPQAWQTSATIGGTPKAKNSEGLKELLAEDFSFTNKKDPFEPFSSFDFASSAAPLAGALALGSALLILVLRWVLSRRV